VQLVARTGLAAAAIAFLVMTVSLAAGNLATVKVSAAALAVCLALGLRAVPPLAGYQFTVWIVAAVTLAMLYPHWFLSVGSISLQDPWIILLIVQAVMFGMGTQMSVRDFAGVIKMPWAVFVGLFCQFTIMPLVGYALARTLPLSPEIAAGIVLIGSCSSGLASNVMVYMARGNVALSITLTTLATMLAPLLTPFWMKLLAGTMVEVSVSKMMVDIVKIVLVPVAAALLHDALNQVSAQTRQHVLRATLFPMLWLMYLGLGGYETLTTAADAPIATIVSLSGFVCGAVVVGVLYHLLVSRWPAIERMMPAVSMFGIVYFVLVATAAGRENLIRVGVLIFLAAVIHNALGFVLGYWMSRGMGLDQSAARTVAIEVGMQNGGMATGLAGAMGKLGTVGLAAIVFATWMNVTGSILANHWRRSAPAASPPAPTDSENEKIS
jgi:BASS family bile acid:Na+ symporter